MRKGAGHLFVITAPSGAGKTSIGRELEAQIEDIRYSVSHTTRPMRPGEVSGEDYHFVDEPTFRGMIDRGEFVEWAQIHGHYYGTSIFELERAKIERVDLLLDIEGEGARQIKSKFPEAVLVFILAPSYEELKSRLHERGQDSLEEIDRRMANARREISYLPEYDFIIVNDDFDVALLRLMSVVFAKRSEREAMWPHLPDEFRQ